MAGGQGEQRLGRLGGGRRRVGPGAVRAAGHRGDHLDRVRSGDVQARDVGVVTAGDAVDLPRGETLACRGASIGAAGLHREEPVGLPLRLGLDHDRVAGPQPVEVFEDGPRPVAVTGERGVAGLTGHLGSGVVPRAGAQVLGSRALDHHVGRVVAERRQVDAGEGLSERWYGRRGRLARRYRLGGVAPLFLEADGRLGLQSPGGEVGPERLVEHVQQEERTHGEQELAEELAGAGCTAARSARRGHGPPHPLGHPDPCPRLSTTVE